MRLRSLGSTFALVVTAVTIPGGPVRAASPPDQYDPFQSTTPVVRDDYTELWWERFVAGPTGQHQPASDYCESLTLDAANSWRLPTVKELLTIVDEGLPKTYDVVAGGTVTRAVDPRVFPNTPGGDYWTSTVSGTNAWVVNFHNGATENVLRSDTARVRCVRDRAD